MSPPPSSAANFQNYQGCYSTADVNFVAINGSSIDQETCSATCFSNSNSQPIYSGVTTEANGTAICACSPSINVSFQTAPADCDVPCGQGAETCGAPNLYDVYFNSLPANASSTTPVANVSSTAPVVSSTASVPDNSSTTASASTNSSATASLPSSSTTASVSDNSSTTASAPVNSTDSASGSSSTSGLPSSTPGSSTTSELPSTTSTTSSTSTTSPTSTSTTSSSPSVSPSTPAGPSTVSGATTGNYQWKYVSCWGEPASGRGLINQLSNPLGTVEGCLNSAQQSGYIHAGLEYGGECWATDGAIGGGQIPESFCNQACSGDNKQICGAGNVLSLYTAGSFTSTTPIATSVSDTDLGAVAWSYQSCWGEPAQGRALGHNIGKSMTVNQCLNLGAKQGYSHCGLEYGGECWCAGYEPFGGQVPESFCNMPCEANKGQQCGSGNILSLYVAKPRQVNHYKTGGSDWWLSTCWGEPENGRALRFPLDNNAKKNVETCLAMGSAKGYNLCGLEFGGECWCSFGDIYGGAIPDSYCDMPCAGNNLQACGGSRTLSVYGRAQ